MKGTRCDSTVYSDWLLDALLFQNRFSDLFSEWTFRLSELLDNRLPAFCTPIRWSSDFQHGQTWFVSPLLFDADWGGLKTTTHDPGSLRILNSQLGSIYPVTHSFLKGLCELGRVKYVAFSFLPPNSLLSCHKHFNMGYRKFHCLLRDSTKCGLMHMVDHYSTQGIKSTKCIKHWTHAGDWLTFDDNNYHSAWNFSEHTRPVLIIDYKPLPLLTNSNKIFRPL
jgi:hypothetical protein